MSLGLSLLSGLAISAFPAAPAAVSASAPQIWDYSQESSPFTEWAQATKTRVVLQTKDYMVLFCVRVPGVKQWAYSQAPENLRLVLEDMSLAAVPQPKDPAKETLTLKRLDLAYRPKGEESREQWLEDPQPKTFLWVLAPPKMPVPLSAELLRARQARPLPNPFRSPVELPSAGQARKLPPPPNPPGPNRRVPGGKPEPARQGGAPQLGSSPWEVMEQLRRLPHPPEMWMLGELPQQAREGVSLRPPPVVWFLGEMLEQARRMAFQSGKPIFFAPFQQADSKQQFSASLMIVNGAVEWTPPAAENLLIVLDGVAEIPAADGGSKVARAKSIVSIPRGWGRALAIKRTSLGSFCALLVTIWP
ncbi:MAG: hypothetical protein NTY77_08060 [Elusimicrobia bacterium]|nr:hypothetical protein [Elusimicrobiota bacterium]